MIFRATSVLFENGFHGMEQTARALERCVDTCVETLSGPPTNKRGTEAPIEGPPDMNAATSELANRLMRLARLRWLEGEGLEKAPNDVLDAIKRSWPQDVNGNLASWLAAPVRMPLALTGLTAQEGLRGIAALRAVRPELWGDFLGYVIETFSDLHVYFSLAYGEDLERRKRAVEKNPRNSTARLELARTYMKCGLFREALDQLDRIHGQDGGSRGRLSHRVHYERLVASYHLGDYAGGLRHGRQAMQSGGTEQARYWTWLASRKTGGYPDGFPGHWRMKATDGFHPTHLELEEVSREMGLDKTSGGRGTAVFDATGDGHLDVVIAGAHAGLSLYRNNGDGTFTDASTGSGLDRVVYAFAVAAGDYNNNGRPDLFVTGLGFFNGQCVLLRNNGVNGAGRLTFTDVTEEAGLGSWGPGFTAIWVDYDGDGFLDLFVVHNLGGLFDRKTPNRLFHNNGDGTFTDVSQKSGFGTTWPSLGACWGDFTNNGRPDLFVSNLGRSQLFANNGDGTFTDVSRRAGITKPGICSGAIACDIDNDGWLDIVQFTYSRPQDAIHTLRHGRGPKGGQPPRVWRNNRDGSFTDIAADLGLTGCWGTMSGAAGDISNSGHLDLLLGNGDPSIDRTEASILYENDGNRFRNVTFAAGMPLTGKGHGANLADLTGDGRLHLIVGAGGLYPGDLMTTTVHRPKSRPGNYLNVRLVGTESNRGAVGARLRLEVQGHRQDRGGQQHRLVSGGSGFGCLPYEQHFGLGEATEISALEIHWPSGRRQRFEGLPINETLRLVEGQPRWEKIYS